MSFMKGDLLTKTRKLVKGLAKAEPVWYKAMEQAPPPTFPRADAIQRITLPEDVYVKKFFKKHLESKYQDTIKFSAFDHPPARIFGLRVLELKEQGVSEQQAMAVADIEYRAEKNAKKKAYAALKQIARQQGKKPPPNPYPSAIKEIQALEKKHVYDRFYNPRIRQILRKLQDEKAIEDQDRMRGGWGGGGGSAGRGSGGQGGGGWGGNGAGSGGGGGGGGWGGSGGGGGWGGQGNVAGGRSAGGGVW
ncbi:hypothetical protein ACLB2K_006978 [Fragaria x ananassa]